MATATKALQDARDEYVAAYREQYEWHEYARQACFSDIKDLIELGEEVARLVNRKVGAFRTVEQMASHAEIILDEMCDPLSEAGLYSLSCAVAATAARVEIERLTAAPKQEAA